MLRSQRSRSLRTACGWLAACALWLPAAVAQGLPRAETAELDPAARRASVAQAITEWVADYEADRLGPKGVLHREHGLQPRYAQAARAAQVLGDQAGGALTHLDALQKLLYYAESDPDEAVGEALLGLAAAGFDKSLVDRDAVILRDLGHWALMRTEHKGVWFLLMRAAAGERLPLWIEDGETPDVDPARRVAALRLLGMKGAPVFRSTIEGALVALDPRVRLAAVEALEFQRRPGSLSVLVRLLRSERHPVVSQGVVRALRSVLSQARRTLPADERMRAICAAMRMFGEAGWRTDMDLIDFVEEFPDRAAVPPLIDVLARAAVEDPLQALVNRRASPLLRQRAHQCLRGLTGAILPADQPEQWREFWEREGPSITVPEQLPHLRPVADTASTFFGIPVTGREIAFVIDTSGSMDEAFGTATAAPRGQRQRDPQLPSRLDAAKEQLLLCVQVMDPVSRYHLLTFADGVHTWSRKAVPPDERATRSLVDLLSRLGAGGGTNLYEALVQALELDQLHFGQEGKSAIDELFLLSDGEPTEGAIKDPEEILQMVAFANRYLHVRINTVFTGTGRGADFLRRLAEENNGVFVQR